MAAAAESSSLRKVLAESITLSNTLIGRDKSIRFWQYLARMLSGLTGREFFAKLLATLAISRKTLRFYKPIKAAKTVDDLLKQPCQDYTARALTLSEVINDGIYAGVDNIAFFQRIGAFPWMNAKQIDNLDRFIEIFWFNEILSVFCREVRSFSQLRTSGSDRDASSEKLLSVDKSAWKRKLNLILIVKALVDMPCALYFLQPAAFRNEGRNKAWCGFLGMIASLMSLHVNWPSQD